MSESEVADPLLPEAAPACPPGASTESPAARIVKHRAALRPAGLAAQLRLRSVQTGGILLLACSVLACRYGLPLSRTQSLTGLVELDVVQGRVKVVQTSLAADERLAWKPELEITEDFPFNGPVVDVDPTLEDQEIVGFGGAFTGASAETFMKLNPELQEVFIDSYFGATGLGFTLGRVHINSCDFSSSSYSFDDVNDDFDLDHFDWNVSQDKEALIPLIQRAKAKVEEGGEMLNLLGTPWSPPAWMKTNGQMDSSGSPCLREDTHEAWAHYVANWITAYKNSGLPIWAISVQNEPTNPAGWEACTMNPEEEASFLGDHLGPIVKGQHPEVGIYVYDDSKHLLTDYVDAASANPAAAQYMDGAAFHWYTGDLFDKVADIHQRYPQVKLLPSEATYERRMWVEGAQETYSDWRFGEGYAHDIIGDLNNGAVGWIDWNLLLQKEGGPNHVGNVCDAAIVADLSAQTLEMHPQYYFLGHFSKFIPPRSRHLASEISTCELCDKTFTPSSGPGPYGTCTGEQGLEATAFRRPDQRIVVVVLNCALDEIEFKLRIKGAGAVQTVAPARSIATYLFSESVAGAIMT